MEKFRLFMGCLGYGITVCNAAVMVCGDYKQIAHITPAGNVKLYVDPDYIPAPEMEKINRAAQVEAERFRNKFEFLPVETQYYKILDAMPLAEMHNAIHDPRALSEKLPDLRAWYYQHN